MGLPRGFVATALVLLPLSSVAAVESGKRSDVRVHPLARAPRSATDGGAGAAIDPRVAALAERLQQHVPRIRAAASAAGGASGRPESAQVLADFHRRVGGDVRVRLRPRLGTPMQIRGGVLQAAATGAGLSGADAAQATARRFLSSNRALLRLDDPDAELELRSAQVDELGRRHFRYAQRYAGLPVWPAEINVHLNPSGQVDLMQGAYVATPRLIRTAPTVTVAAARERARAALPSGSSPTAGDAVLIIYAPLDRTPRLAWKLDVPIAVDSRWLVVVDALDGAILAAFDQIQRDNVPGSGDDLFGTSRNLNVFEDGDGTLWMVDTSKPMFDATSQPPLHETTRGAIIIFDARNQPPTSTPMEIPPVFYVTSTDANSWDVPDAVSAAFGLSETYDYYFERHGRDSLDGEGGAIYAIVRLGQNFFNAFWNGTLMAFGTAEPFAGSLDVVGHELTHGVTERTAHLVYRAQSGAMNESFSDIFGEMIEERTFGENDWLLGSDLSQPLRNMADPEQFGDPATMSDFFVTEEDNGGVHTNSGIFNRAFYLAAEGLNDAIGHRDAERIFFRALTIHLVANSQFVDGRLACVTAAEELFGANSTQARVTARAFDTVEILDGNSTPEPPPFPEVSGADSTLFLSWDPFAEAYFLHRREEDLGDPSDGIRLVDIPVAAHRPAVSGDGSFAVFVTAEHDVCFVLTDGTPLDPESDRIEDCLGFDFISAVGIAPDGEHFGFVLLDDAGDPDNRIRIIDLSNGGKSRTFDLRAPSEDGGDFDTVLYADTMELTADNRFVIYDALNETELFDGTELLAWSIYAIDLVTDETLDLVPAVVGFDIGFPALSQTSDNFITFDVFDEEQGQSAVMTANLTNGEMRTVATVDGFGAPVYVGDDSAIVYSQPDDTPTEFSLVRQPLAADRLSPQGAPGAWLTDADYGIIYRRGSFTGPQPTPTSTVVPTPRPTSTPGRCVGDCDGNGEITISELVRGVNIVLGRAAVSQCPRFDVDGDGTVRINELVAAVRAVLSGCVDD